jgi:hypothetical protein
MNNTSTNQGGYVSTGVEYVNSTDVGKAYVDSLYTNLPDDGPNGLKANIKQVTVTCNSGDRNADGTDDNGMSTYTTYVHMFLASAKEVGITFSRYQYDAEGTCFDLFTTDNSSRTGFMSTANISYFWLRSAMSYYTYAFCRVNPSGNGSNPDATYTCTIVPAFVIG